MVISYFTLQDVQSARNDTTVMIKHALVTKHTTTVSHDEPVTNVYLYKYDYNYKISFAGCSIFTKGGATSYVGLISCHNHQ